MENAVLLGVPFPERVKNALEEMREKEEKPHDEKS